LNTGNKNLLNRALTQEGKMVEQSVIPIFNEEDQVIATLITEKDISEKVAEESKMKALSEATKTLSELMIGFAEDDPIVPEVIEEALFYIGDDYKIRYYNLPAEKLMESMSITNCTVGSSIIHGFPFLKELLRIPEAMLGRDTKENKRYFRVKKLSLKRGEEEEGTLIIIQDYTELKEKERELILKSVAIREIHHRVKNNLQTIASLIRLQINRGVPSQSEIYFQETLNRVRSIASVYEITLAESSTDYVNIDLLIKKVSNMIVYTDDQAEKTIDINYSGVNYEISSNRAVTIALIVNELIHNCVKHAFVGMDYGLINITFTTKENTIELKVIDNGVGYSPDTKPSFGLDIVSTMVEYDLEGSFSIDKTEEGTVAKVIFQYEGNDFSEKENYRS